MYWHTSLQIQNLHFHLCLTVSGGHTQIVLVESHLNMKVIGEVSRDDAVGEAFDKAAKMMGFPYLADR